MSACSLPRFYGSWSDFAARKASRKGIEGRHGEVEKIDAETRRVTVGGNAIDADYLVVSLGAELAPETAPGLEDAGHSCTSSCRSDG